MSSDGISILEPLTCSANTTLVHIISEYNYSTYYIYHCQNAVYASSLVVRVKATPPLILGTVYFIIRWSHFLPFPSFFMRPPW